jgi:hypothetical protein
MNPSSADNDPDSDVLLKGIPAKAWALGAALPVALVVYGLICVKIHSALFILLKPRGVPGHGGITVFHGSAAVGLGVAYLGIGVFLHFYVFWYCRERFERAAQVGMFVSVLAVAEGVCYFIMHALEG